MDKNITVKQAIKKGHLMLSLPGVTILFGLMTSFIVLTIKGVIPGFWALLGFPISFIATVIFGCFSMVKWRIWAFSRVPVAEWEELRAHAVDNGLIFRKGSFLEKIEIKFPADKIKVEEFEAKEVETDPIEFEDDQKIPNKSEFTFSKSVLYVSLIRNAIIIVVGIFLVMIDPASVITYILPIIGLILSISPITKLRRKAVPKLVLNTKGIGVDDEFYNWEYISKETARMKGIGKGRTDYIFFEFRGEDISIDLSSYEVPLPDLRHLLKIYRHRSNLQLSVKEK